MRQPITAAPALAAVAAAWASLPLAGAAGQPQGASTIPARVFSPLPALQLPTTLAQAVAVAVVFLPIKLVLGVAEAAVRAVGVSAALRTQAARCKLMQQPIPAYLRVTSVQAVWAATQLRVAVTAQTVRQTQQFLPLAAAQPTPISHLPASPAPLITRAPVS